MIKLRRAKYFAGLALTFVALVGCGGGPKMAPVEGTVTLNGKPLDKIMVEFWPQAEGTRSFGETDAQGHYSLMSDDGKRSGAVVGSHKVTLKDASVLGDKFMGRKAETMDITEGRKSRIGPIYNNTDKTPFTHTVEAKKNTFDFDVKAK